MPRGVYKRKKTPTVIPQKETTAHEPQIPKHLEAFAFGYTLAWIDSYARSHGIPAELLARRVGALLQSTPGG